MQAHSQNRDGEKSSVPEIIDPVFAKTSPKRSFSMTEYERFGLVFTKFGHRSDQPVQYLNVSHGQNLKSASGEPEFVAQ
jgi:hypothetical protein